MAKSKAELTKVSAGEYACNGWRLVRRCEVRYRVGIWHIYKGLDPVPVQRRRTFTAACKWLDRNWKK